jgi:hypothetical protein
MKAKTKRRFGQMWGYAILAIVVYCWLGTNIGPAPIAAGFGLVFLYALFQAPMWCCATTRQGDACRNNSYGLLLGCHIRHHRWQKVKMAVRASSWGALANRVLSGMTGVAASVSALASVAGVFVSVGGLIVA